MPVVLSSALDGGSVSGNRCQLNRGLNLRLVGRAIFCIHAKWFRRSCSSYCEQKLQAQ
jgi:hypothetical protein